MVDKLEDLYMCFVMVVIVVGIIFTIYDWIAGMV